MKYHKEWVIADNMLGLFIDHDKAYYTHEDRYIEREWQYLKRAWEQNLLGEGQYVVAYCPHCQTSLSNAEVGLGYKEVEDPIYALQIPRERHRKRILCCLDHHAFHPCN